MAASELGDDLLLLVHITEYLSEAKISSPLNSDAVSLGRSCQPIVYRKWLPLRPSTRGVKTPQSIFQTPFTILSLIGLLMFSIGISAGCNRVKYLCFIICDFEKPLAWLSSQALLSLLAECAIRVSPVRGCSGRFCYYIAL